MAARRPALVVIGGPNGSGKTTLTVQLLQHQWLNDCVYINPDQIAREDFGDWNDPAAVLKAARRADEIRDDCLARRQSLAFETVFSTRRRLVFLSLAKQSGYFVRLFFVGTADASINIRRVRRRVLAGGHDVPEAKIVARYASAMTLLPEAAKLADRAYLYDNSHEDAPVRRLCRVSDGVLVKSYIEPIPEWARPTVDAVRSCRSTVAAVAL